LSDSTRCENHLYSLPVNPDPLQDQLTREQYFDYIDRVERWLGELAFAPREEIYQPNPIRRVFTLKANGKLRRLGISTLRDRVCMTAAMLVLEPIFEADLPPEQYAYRPGRRRNQRVDQQDSK